MDHVRNWTISDAASTQQEINKIKKYKHNYDVSTMVISDQRRPLWMKNNVTLMHIVKPKWVLTSGENQLYNV